MHYALMGIREAGVSAGAAINPSTPADALAEVAEDLLGVALCMSVDPGWGAQELIPASLGKLERMRAALPRHVALGVDGGVHRETAADCAAAGANLLVAGSAVFESDDPGAAYAEIAVAAGALQGS
jgi:ribulose-phosphate 3-epimerase